MTGLSQAAGTSWWYILAVAAVVLITGAFSVMIWDIRYSKNRKLMLAAVLNLVLAFIIFYILAFLSLQLYYNRDSGTIWDAASKLPWIVYAVLEAVSFVILLLCIRESIRYRRSHITHGVIRETVNMFPEGLAVSANDGTVLLSNLIMDRLSRELTGGHLSDAGLFWEKMREIGEDQNGRILVSTSNGEMWLLSREQLSADGSDYVQLTAADVTERFQIIKELKEKNAHLQDIQRRMKAVTELSGDMFVAQESAAARAALHNQLGQVLLMEKYFLEHPESADASMVYVTTTQMNSFLLGEAEKSEEDRENVVKEAEAAAQRIGVRVQMEGSVPDNDRFKRLLAYAVKECAANAVKHADGTELTVVLSENTAVLTNNGRPPKHAIEESGGLLALRKEVEAAGGKMSVDSLPRFRLTIQL